MKIDDIVKIFLLQLRDSALQVLFQKMQFVDVGIGLENGPERSFGEIVNFGRGHLLLQATDHRGGQNNIANGRETDDQELHAAKIIFAFVRLFKLFLYVVEVFVKGFFGKGCCHKSNDHDDDGCIDASFNITHSFQGTQPLKQG